MNFSDCCFFLFQCTLTNYLFFASLGERIEIYFKYTHEFEVWMLIHIYSNAELFCLNQPERVREKNNNAKLVLFLYVSPNRKR